MANNGRKEKYAFITSVLQLVYYAALMVSSECASTLTWQAATKIPNKDP